MDEYGGFEGNAQTLRLITKRIFTEKAGRVGMGPTRALMDSVCKYKEIWRPELNHHFLYNDQEECLQFIHNGLNVKEQSIECQIMDWSDDIANAYADINDGIKARLISVSALEQWAASQSLDSEDSTSVKKLIDSIQHEYTERLRASGIGESIEATSVAGRSGPLSSMTNRYCYGIKVQPDVRKRCNLMKRIATEIVFQSAVVQQLEMKAHIMMKNLFDLLLENYVGSASKMLLPQEVHAEIVAANGRSEKARFICDHLSGMSDDFAVRTYRRLFDPQFGSMTDFV